MKLNTLTPGGIVPPLVTPITRTGEIDRETLQSLISHVISEGVSAVFLLGTNGEIASLSQEQKEIAIATAVKAVRGRLPVWVGVCDTVVERSLSLARFAAESGADALVWAPPYYFPQGSEDLFSLFRDLHDRFPLPVLLYNIPGITKSRIDLAFLEKAARLEKVLGFKDSSGDEHFFLEVLSRFTPGNLSCYIGSESLLPTAISNGASGGICGGANVFPKLYSELHSALGKKNSPAAERLMNLVLEVHALVELCGGGYAGGIRAFKAGLARLGIGSGLPLRPLNPLSLEQDRLFQPSFDLLREKIDAYFQTSEKSKVATPAS